VSACVATSPPRCRLHILCGYCLEHAWAFIFLEYGVAPRPVQVLYDRRDSAFSCLTPDLVDWEPVRRGAARARQRDHTGTGAQPRMLVERIFDEAAMVSFDINYRSTLWSPAEARSFAESVLPRARYVFLGRTEAQIVFGLEGGAEDILDALARRAPKATIALLQGAEALPYSMATGCGVQPFATPCRWWIQSARRCLCRRVSLGDARREKRRKRL